MQIGDLVRDLVTSKLYMVTAEVGLGIVLQPFCMKYR